MRGLLTVRHTFLAVLFLGLFAIAARNVAGTTFRTVSPKWEGGPLFFFICRCSLWSCPDAIAIRNPWHKD
jgi:hypothetical protein